MTLSKTVKDLTLELSLVGTLLGLVVFVLSTLAIFFTSVSIGADFDSAVGAWKYWLFLIGLILAIIAGIFLGSFIVNRKEFLELIETDSKATFKRNQDDIEYLAWKLGTKYERVVEAKKDELKLDGRRSKR